MDKKFIDSDLLKEEFERTFDMQDLYLPIHFFDVVDSMPAADVQEKKDCEKCIHFDRHATEYPCSHCRNCYTDKFQPMPSCGARMDGEENDKRAIQQI